jgi:hypothetical protein
VHDADYQKAPAEDATLWKSLVSPWRKLADESYREALQANRRLAPWKAELIYRGVRVAGWWAFYRHARTNAKKQGAL